MSSTYKPVVRKRDVIGCNIPPGFTPGSFSKQFGIKRIGRRKKHGHHRSASREVCEAANRVLERRGFINQPNWNDSTVKGGFSR